MISIKLSEETRRMLENQSKNLSGAILRGFRNTLYSMVTKAKNTFGRTGQLHIVTGHLRRSIKSEVKREGDLFIGSIGSNVIYAAPHEFGAVITPKRSPFLIFNVGGKSFRRKAYKKVALGKEAYFKEGIKGGNWVKVRSVKIPARPFIGPSVRNSLRSLDRNINEEIQKLLKG